MFGRLLNRGLRGRFRSAHPRLFFAAATLGFLGAVGFGYGAYVGAPPVIYRDGLVYISMREDAPWLSRSVRLGLRTPPPRAEAGALVWRELAPGLEIGELPVMADGEEVDRLYLTRIDPTRYRFEIHTDANNDLNAWMSELNPTAVINASYYDNKNGPATPVRIGGRYAGPADYDARHGAFVASTASASIVDLASTAWRSAMDDSETALVSYPLLLDADGGNRAEESRWLASRSFIAEVQGGRIVLGSAPEGFFSLYRLGEFLRRAPLDLQFVLNLDGGPVACHGVNAGGVTKLVYGHVELQSDGVGMPLRVLPGSQVFRSPMPIVLAVFPREEAPSARE